MAQKKPTLMRSIGRFFGHVVQGAKADVDEPGKKRVEIRREVQEETRDAPPEMGGGKMTIRRTTIEEVELRREPPDSAG